MDDFTASWWVVNTSIVVICSFTYHAGLLVVLPFEGRIFIVISLSLLSAVVIYMYLLLPGLVPVIILLGWPPRVIRTAGTINERVMPDFRIFQT